MKIILIPDRVIDLLIDAVLNFLGSFTIDVVPNNDGSSVTYTVTNILSWESATRFRKGTGESGSYTSRGPVIESTERTWDANKYLGIGGNLRCKWIWEKFF